MKLLFWINDQGFPIQIAWIIWQAAQLSIDAVIWGKMYQSDLLWEKFIEWGSMGPVYIGSSSWQTYSSQ